MGIFYFITHNDPEAEGPHNVTNLIRENPENPRWGNGSHYWGEPEIGYYLSHEEWAIRRHAYLLSDAGVDVIIIDVTNDRTYPKTYLTIFKVFEEMRLEGEETPSIAFLGSEISVNKLWTELYSQGRYKDLWFQWDGKPLLLYGQHEIPSRNRVNQIEFSNEIEDFFTLKQSWAWTTLPWYETGQDEWPWVDHYPQAVSWDEKPGHNEMVPVSVAQHPLSNIGRSFHNFHQPKTDSLDLTPVTGKGLYFQEQWNRALEVDPEFVFVTGWNEWSAGRQIMGSDVSQELQKWKFYPGAHLGKVGEKIEPGDTYFIDQYNQEYSRDIEPMKGGHTDNYYYQLMANIRRYKGMRPLKKARSVSIDLSGSFQQWKPVSAIFLDHKGDTGHRHSLQQGKAGPYIDLSGRNDLLEMRVTHDRENFYFYVQTADPITTHKEKNWMILLIDADQDVSTGWQGYDWMVNGNGVSKERTPLRKYHDRKKTWIKVDELPYKVEENQMMLRLPRGIMKSGNFDFHWVDNPKNLQSIVDFFTAGDNAPTRRANYRYEFE